MFLKLQYALQDTNEYGIKSQEPKPEPIRKRPPNIELADDVGSFKKQLSVNRVAVLMHNETGLHACILQTTSRDSLLRRERKRLFVE